MVQRSFWEMWDPRKQDFDQQLSWLKRQRFDIRKRSYETYETYQTRVFIVSYAFTVQYTEPKWSSIKNWVEICPRGEDNRLPENKSELPPHQCYYLEIKNVTPEDWLVPVELSQQQAQQLPARATYKPKWNDIFLSRFKDPLGKCVIYEGEPAPLYVNSNFFLLRSKKDVDPFFLLGLLKSPFIAYQLHRIIQPRSVITEMFQKEVLKIMLPNLSTKLQNKIIECVKARLSAEKEYRVASKINKRYNENAPRRNVAQKIMNEVDQVINGIIIQFLQD